MYTNILWLYAITLETTACMFYMISGALKIFLTMLLMWP